MSNEFEIEEITQTLKIERPPKEQPKPTESKKNSLRALGIAIVGVIVFLA